MARRKKAEKKRQAETQESGQCLTCLKIVPVGGEGVVLKHRNHIKVQCAGVGSVAGPPPPKFGTCPVCHLKVAKGEAGLIGEHRSGDKLCGGAGRAEYDGPPVGYCQTCGKFQRLRATDGRIAAHQVQGSQCEGSGKTPSSGREKRHMNGLSVSVLRGGLPGMGKRNR